MQQAKKTIISIDRSILKPKFTTIGYGNPRYNSMVVLPDDRVIIPCGVTLRKVDLIENQVLYNKQIGSSQIFQIMEFQKWLMVISFQGLISILDKQTLEEQKQFYANGKEIRHSSIRNQYIALSLQLNQGTEEAKIQVYSMDDILSAEGISLSLKPKFSKTGWYFYPELVGKQLIFIEYYNPNPKGRFKKVDSNSKKLAITSKILCKNLEEIEEQFKQIYTIKFGGQIICAVQNSKTQQIFYLHQSKKLTILWLQTRTCEQIDLIATASPHCIESYENGILFGSKTDELTYLEYTSELQIKQIKLKTKSLTTSYCLKAAKTNQKNFIFFNETGLHYYSSIQQKTYSQHCFYVTNCGLSINKDGNQFTVGDFGGNVYIFSIDHNNIVPQPVAKTCVGVPIRTLVWCHDSNKIIIGCLGGYLYSWDGFLQEPEFVFSTNYHTINIVRKFSNFFLLGTSNGYVHILSSSTLKQIYSFQAHMPIQYSDSKQRELFGTMKHYAQIWSITGYPTSHSNIFNLATCSEDQTIKIFKIQSLVNGSFIHNLIHHLKGHTLAVTSIDWKKMGKGIGQLFVSCSDDQIIRFRDPQNQFEIIYEVQTTSIKQWHTLTYLILQPNGFRVAIGSQSGYLFIFDIYSKILIFSEKIHLGGVQGIDWINNKLISCSSDLCISILTL